MIEYADGPYCFGDAAPRHLMGLLEGDMSSEDLEALDNIPFLPRDIWRQPAPTALPWEIAKQQNGGEHLPTVLQLSGDCVAAGCSQAIRYAGCIELENTPTARPIAQPFIPFIYGVARVKIGGGRIKGEGAFGCWGARAVSEFGWLPDDTTGCPNYTKRCSDDWGRSSTYWSDWLPIAAKTRVKSIEKCRTLSDCLEALDARRTLTIASSQGFEMRPRIYEGYHVWTPSGTWYHQMSIIAHITKPIDAVYRLNSWGPNAHGTPKHDEPPGGAWQLTSDLYREIESQPGIEIFAYSSLSL